jgi:hypothetical protein
MKKALGCAIVMIAFVAWVLVLSTAGAADAKRGGGGHDKGGHYVSGGQHISGQHGARYHGGGYYGGGYYGGRGGTVIVDDDESSLAIPCVWTGYGWRCYD